MIVRHPVICSVSSAFFLVGSYLYQVGYADMSLDIKMARYKKGGIIKFVGVLGLLGSTISAAGTWNNWW